MFLERFAVFTLQVRAKLLSFYSYLLRETDSQLGQIFFTCCLFILTGILIYVWFTAYPLWLKISFTVIYLLSSLFCISAIYFLLSGKRVRTSSMEILIFNNKELEKSPHFNLNSIPLTEVQAKAVFEAFSIKYITGSYESFQSLILLESISIKKRLEWKDLSPKGPKQVNRQTLLEFLSNLLAGFENLENHQIMELVDHYFILKSSSGIEQTLSTKNISDWRINKASYLKEISQLFQQHL